MILQWLCLLLINCFNKQPEIKDQTTIEIIDSVIKHFNKLPTNSKIHTFLIYNLPCSSFGVFKTIVKDFLITMEYLETPKTIKLQTITYEDTSYIKYFKKAVTDVHTREDVKKEILYILSALKNHLNIIANSQPDYYHYYSSRCDLIIGHCVCILETLTHE